MNRPKVLLVDDISLMLELEKLLLGDIDADLITADNGREALEIIRREQPAVVFMDLFMPEMDGDECCRLVKADPELRTIPIVMVTKAEGPHLERCRQAGCDEIISKPVDGATLLSYCEKFLELQASRFQRTRVHLEVSFKRDGTSQFLRNCSVNLSTGGLFLQTEELEEVDTPLTLEFFLPNRRDPISCQGRVAWINPLVGRRHHQLPPGMGIQFLGLSLEEMWTIREFLRDSEAGSQLALPPRRREVKPPVSA